MTIMNTDALHLRQTAKFNPIQQQNTTTICSKIILPLGKNNAKQRHIKWFRYYAKTIQRLLYMDDLMLYQCSPLDLDCKIESVVEYLYQQRQSHISMPYDLPISKFERTISQKFSFGPCKMDSKIEIKPSQYMYTGIPITLIFDGNKPEKQAKLFIDSGVIIQGTYKYGLTVEDVCSIYIGNIKSYQLAIGSLNQGKALNKLFKEVKYKQNSHLPTKIVFLTVQSFNTTLFLINKLKFSFGSKTSLKSLANYKSQMSLSFTSDNADTKQNANKQNFQKQSNLSTGICNVSPPHSLNQRVKTTTSTINSPHGMFSPTNQTLKNSDLTLNKNFKNSQLASDNSFPTTNHEQQQQQNFMVEFDDLFQDQKQQEQLCLNNSFEQFQKRAKQYQDLERIKEIEKKKQEKKKSKKECQNWANKIMLMENENKYLEEVNMNLRTQLQIIKDIKNDPQISVSQLETKIIEMRQYYNHMQNYRKY